MFWLSYSTYQNINITTYINVSSLILFENNFILFVFSKLFVQELW